MIMTSNIGSQRILEYRGAFDGAVYERMKKAVLEEMRHHFRPEFLNRVDETIVFHAPRGGAPEEDRGDSTERLRPGWRSGTSAGIDGCGAANLVRTGYDPHYGARPLKRTIQKKVETPLGRRILKGEIRDGQRMLVDVDRAGELTFAGFRSRDAERWRRGDTERARAWG